MQGGGDDDDGERAWELRARWSLKSRRMEINHGPRDTAASLDLASAPSAKQRESESFGFDAELDCSLH